jgi:transcriptional regulator with XRE-family HTH domain
MRLTAINNKTLSNWEHNVSKPDPDELARLAKLYDVSVDWLVGNTTAREPLSPYATLAAHRPDFRDELPPEAIEEINNFIAYQLAQHRARQKKKKER